MNVDLIRTELESLRLRMVALGYPRAQVFARIVVGAPSTRAWEFGVYALTKTFDPRTASTFGAETFLAGFAQLIAFIDSVPRIWSDADVAATLGIEP